jgi:hypothetical protein
VPFVCVLFSFVVFSALELFTFVFIGYSRRVRKIAKITKVLEFILTVIIVAAIKTKLIKIIAVFCFIILFFSHFISLFVKTYAQEFFKIKIIPQFRKFQSTKWMLNLRICGEYKIVGNV